MEKKGSKKAGLSRRAFSRGFALAAAAPVGLASAGASSVEAGGATPGQNAAASSADSAYQNIIARYGQRFSEEEKADIKRLAAQIQKTSEALNAFPLENEDEPATVFRPYRPVPKSGPKASNSSKRSGR
jgi:hypothetical protein